MDSIQESDLNHHQDIARHSFCDMVNDYDRNNKYAGAIERVVQAAKKRDGFAYVFDVGCGSGLLTMLSLKFGADFVYAVEQNNEMSKTAKRILEQNGFIDDFQIVRTRLEDVQKLGLERSFPKSIKKANRCKVLPNIVTAELFDSEMIGEDALRIYKAIRALVSRDALFVPTSGKIFVQLVNSPFFNSCHELAPSIDVNGKSLIIPNRVNCCNSSSEIQDLHLDRFADQCSKDILSEPIPLFEFDFSCVDDDKKIQEQKAVKVVLKREIKATDKLCLLFWWTSRMDLCSSSEMTTAPHWILGVSEKWSPWREHWLPLIYHFPIKQHKDFIYNNIGKREIQLYCSHDEFQFAINLNEQSKDDFLCDCGVHSFLGRAGMFQFNNHKRFQDWMDGFNEFIEKISQERSHKNDIKLLFLGDFSPLPFLITGNPHIRTIYIDVSDEVNGRHKRKCYETVYTDTIEIDNIVFYTGKEGIDFNVVAFDDYLTTKSIFTHDFGGNILHQMNQTDREFCCYPEAVNIHLDFFKFEQLFKNYRQVEETQEFDFSEYDRLIMKSRWIADDLPDLVNCSEYRSTIIIPEQKNIDNGACVENTYMYRLSTKEFLKRNAEFNTKFPIAEEIFQQSGRKQIACVLWTSFQKGLGESFSYNCPSFVNGNVCQWPPFTNQFVQFFEQIPGSEKLCNHQRILNISWKGHKNGLKLFIE